MSSLFFFGGVTWYLCVCVRTRSMYAYHLESIMYVYYLYMICVLNWCHLLYQNAGGNGMKWWFGMDFCLFFLVMLCIPLVLSTFVALSALHGGKKALKKLVRLRSDLRPTALAQMSHSAWFQTAYIRDSFHTIITIWRCRCHKICHGHHGQEITSEIADG